MSFLEIITPKGRRLMLDTSLVAMVTEPDDLSQATVIVLKNGNAIPVEGESYESVCARVAGDNPASISPVRVYNTSGMRVLPNGAPDRTASRLVVQ